MIPITARVCVENPSMEEGSGIAFVASPTNWPRAFTAKAALSYPPSKIPRSVILPCFQPRVGAKANPKRGAKLFRSGG